MFIVNVVCVVLLFVYEFFFFEMDEVVFSLVVFGSKGGSFVYDFFGVVEC